MVHAFKYNGWLYRSWDFPLLILNDKDLIILELSKSRVISDEPGTRRCFNSLLNKKIYWIFMKKEWFNFRITINPTNTKIYINLASPFFYEESAIKYYDFDLDFKYHNHGIWNEIDINDFLLNSQKYRYPKKLIKVIKNVEKRVWYLIDKGFFNKFIDPQFLSNLDYLADKYNYELGECYEE